MVVFTCPFIPWESTGFIYTLFNIDMFVDFPVQNHQTVLVAVFFSLFSPATSRQFRDLARLQRITLNPDDATHHLAANLPINCWVLCSFRRYPVISTSIRYCPGHDKTDRPDCNAQITSPVSPHGPSHGGSKRHNKSVPCTYYFISSTLCPLPLGPTCSVLFSQPNYRCFHERLSCITPPRYFSLHGTLTKIRQPTLKNINKKINKRDSDFFSLAHFFLDSHESESSQNRAVSRCTAYIQINLFMPRCEKEMLVAIHRHWNGLWLMLRPPSLVCCSHPKGLFSKLSSKYRNKFKTKSFV